MKEEEKASTIKGEEERKHQRRKEDKHQQSKEKGGKEALAVGAGRRRGISISDQNESRHRDLV